MDSLVQQFIFNPSKGGPASPFSFHQKSFSMKIQNKFGGYPGFYYFCLVHLKIKIMKFATFTTTEAYNNYSEKVKVFEIEDSRAVVAFKDKNGKYKNRASVALENLTFLTF